MSDNQSKISTVVYYSVAGVVAFIIFLIDLRLPLGVAGGSLYAGLALIGLLASNRNLILLGAVVGSVFTVIGFFASPSGGEVWAALINRVISILTIWMTALICLNKQKSNTELQKTHHNLENRIAERTQSLYEINSVLENKNKYIQLHKNIAEKVNENLGVDEIFQFCLKQICILANAQIGHLYLAENRYSSRLLPGKIWYMENESEFKSFRALTELHTFESGIGLPGRVHEVREPVWIESIDQDLNFPRASNDTNFSVKSGFAFPIFIGQRITGVMEFFFSKQKDSDHELLELMRQTGIQLGRALERSFSEEDRDKLLRSLKERVKELTCMSEIAKLITVTRTMDDILSSIDQFIVPAWQFPDLTHSRISFDKKVFGTQTFPETPWVLSTDIIVNGEKRGCLEVCYSAKPPGTGDDVFLYEEKNLLTWLGQVLSSATSRLINAAELESSNTELRTLYSKLEHVREEERTRIAREIHDELGQALTISKIDLTWLKLKTENTSIEIDNKINEMMQHIDTTLQELNRITSELRPHVLNVMGLLEALKLETEKFINLTGIKCDVQLSNIIPELHPELSTLIFRVYQEALTNIVRHSEANNVNIEFISEEDSLSLTIKDDGKGLDTDKVYNSNSFGLTGMRERVKEWDGKFSITGALGKGTQVFISLPLLKISTQ